MGVVVSERAAVKCQLCMNCDKTPDSMIGREIFSCSNIWYQRTEIAMAPPQNVERFLAVSSAYASAQQSRSGF